MCRLYENSRSHVAHVICGMNLCRLVLDVGAFSFLLLCVLFHLCPPPSPPDPAWVSRGGLDFTFKSPLYITGYL